ncbi:MAG: hypothetical protein Q7S93_01800 [Phenylobacterium sp.]|uniref:hypothetical protein n=1 Tax=Phenylobacterium sp. TaxID=1871053 RepID=UPI002719D74E|nr:hypothetical protein [Phenylobacterium sp.]MDO8408785.1 hypothetical protein [Phenylobacterium sp.]
MTGFWTGARLGLGLAAASALAPMAVLAQTPASPPGRAAVLQSLLDCRSLSEDSARLACYDQAAGAMDQAEAQGDIVVVDREQARNVRRQAFGFSLPSLALFERGEAPDDIDNVTGVAKRAYQAASGKWVIELEDGAVWQQTDTEKLVRRPRPGTKVEIRKASMGSFFMNLDGQRAVRAQRVE